jgi:hypothetical protein
MKKCRRCNLEKKLEHFNKNQNQKDNLSLWCKQCFSLYNKIRYSDDIIKQNHLNTSKSWYLENKEKASTQNKEWMTNNREKYNENQRDKWKNDSSYRLKKLLRCQLNQYLNFQYVKKSKSAAVLLGCTIEHLKKHLEFQFLPEMSWGNHGTIWEIDHIKPCSLFDLTDVEQQKECFHYINLQPLFKTTKIAESFSYTNHIGNRNKNKTHDPNKN